MKARLVTVSVAAAAALAASPAAPSGGARLLRIAYVVPVAAAPSPHDLYGAALLGFQRAVKHFHVAARVVEFPPGQGAGPTLEALARQRYDLIMIGEVRTYADIVTALRVAREFPAAKFVLTDPPGLQRWPPNVQGAIWHVEEPAYLAGYLAGLTERARPGKDVVGSVGGFAIPVVNTFIAGFEAGARAADPGITLLRDYTDNFLNAARCRASAFAQIAKGAGVVFDVAGVCGLGALAAAKEKGVWGVGVDVDQSFLGPHILTSVLKRFDVQVYDTVRELVAGRLRTGGNAVWDLQNGAVGLGRISPRVPRRFLRDLDRVRAAIAAGKVAVPGPSG